MRKSQSNRAGPLSAQRLPSRQAQLKTSIMKNYHFLLLTLQIYDSPPTPHTIFNTERPFINQRRECRANGAFSSTEIYSCLVVRTEHVSSAPGWDGLEDSCRVAFGFSALFFLGSTFPSRNRPFSPGLTLAGMPLPRACSCRERQVWMANALLHVFFVDFRRVFERSKWLSLRYTRRWWKRLPKGGTTRYLCQCHKTRSREFFS